MVRNGENSVTRCIGTSSWSYALRKRAATLIVGWNFRPLPIWARMPLCCSSVGVWIAPPHTKTCSARIVIDSVVPSGRVRSPRTPVTRSPSFSSLPMRQSATICAPASTARGMSVRAIVCFTPRPALSYLKTRANSTARQPSFAAPRSSTADDGGGAPGSIDTDSSFSTRSE